MSGTNHGTLGKSPRPLWREFCRIGTMAFLVLLWADNAKNEHVQESIAVTSVEILYFLHFSLSSTLNGEKSRSQLANDECRLLLFTFDVCTLRRTRSLPPALPFGSVTVAWAIDSRRQLLQNAVSAKCRKNKEQTRWSPWFHMFKPISTRSLP